MEGDSSLICPRLEGRVSCVEIYGSVHQQEDAIGKGLFFSFILEGAKNLTLLTSKKNRALALVRQLLWPEPEPEPEPECGPEARPPEADSPRAPYPRAGAQKASPPPSHTTDYPRGLRPSRSRTRGCRLVAALLLSMLTPAAALSPKVDLNTQKETGVCTSMDIRNSPQMFQVLSGCRVVEGFLHILLFDRLNETYAYSNLSFPELREITGYLMMYRVNGLRSLATLFPNLAVIRGHELFDNYAFILYEMMNMEEIGLHSLTDISRGSVRIEKNYMMCYVNTIDWNVIARNGKEGHYIKYNKPENECPVCPGDNGSKGALLCPEAPPRPHQTGKRHLCWNQNYCQKVCKPECGSNTCTASGQCCDASCLGGCTGPLLDNCTVCRDLSIGDLRDRKCIKDCPNNTFKHQDRRCITEQECRSLPKPKEMLESDKIAHPYKPINGSCMLDCPPNFFEVVEKDVAMCHQCVGTCRKNCTSMNVDSIQAIQQLKGCTHITGSLEISIRGGVAGSIVKELEEGLGLIEEISGSLKIVRSYPLVSLNFLKSLRVIRGEDKFEHVENALSVTDNQNLQELWDWDTHGPLNITHGKLFFHFNPKLCMEKIEPLRDMTRETEFTELEVARNSNGDKVACNVTVLNVTVAKRLPTSMLLSWKAFKHDDFRSLLGYVVHSIEAPHRNVTLYEGRDACGGDGWHLDDIQATMKDDKVYHLLTHLKPYTQYAIYVKTYTIATERLGAQSNIMYVRTLPGQPSPPRITMALATSPSTLMLRWEPPEQPQGNVTQYKVAVKWEEDREDLFLMRNYCLESLDPSPPKPILDIEESLNEKREKERKEKEEKDKCQCEVKKWDEDEAVGQITFEDRLHNQVYKKREPLSDSRRRRDIDAAVEHWDGKRFPASPPNQQPQSFQDFRSVKIDGVYYVYVQVVDKQTSLNISDLHHYAAHSISIWACREVEEAELMDKNSTAANCSVKSIETARTLKLEGADDITGLRVKVQASNQSLGVARLEWKEPEKPNGLIVKYYIMYKRVDLDNHSPITECIPRQQFKNNGMYHIIKGLNAGNYSVMVMATSLAGSGNYSAAKFFIIEDTGNNMSASVVIAIVLGIIAVLLLTMGLAMYVYRRILPPPPPPTKLIASVNPEYVSTVYVPDEWEVSRDSIQLLKELGQGSFGMVYEGIAQDLKKDGKDIRCAVKTVNEHATERERIDFLNEASVMKAFDTAHVVRLLGVVSRGQPTLVVMELMASGDLKSYLRSHRPDQEQRSVQPPSLERILQMAMEIADGMAYLAAKKFVHRDLAARNCMVAGDLTVKVGDFGMTRDIYETDYYRKGSKGLLPVRWMSPESLKDGVFTSSSDVWSYGVVLWEMATLALQPYLGLSNDQVLRYVIDAGVMERPENCPDRLYQLMEMTWQFRPTMRPTFLQLVSYLVSDCNPEFRNNAFYFSPQGQELLNSAQPHSAGVVELEPEASGSRSLGGGPWAAGLASLEDSDSSAPATPRASTSYRDMISLVPYGERARAEPHETEALVGGGQARSAPAPPKPSPPVPNGLLAPNNGNTSSLNTSRC